MKSWKTSLGGILAALGFAMTESPDETIKAIGKVLEALGLLIVGFGAKDFNVSGKGGQNGK